MAGKWFDENIPSKSQRESGEEAGERRTEKPAKEQKTRNPQLKDIDSFKEDLARALNSAKVSNEISDDQIVSELLRNAAQNMSSELCDKVFLDENAMSVFDQIRQSMTSKEAVESANNIAMLIILNIYRDTTPAAVTSEEPEWIMKNPNSACWELVVKDPKAREDLAKEPDHGKAKYEAMQRSRNLNMGYDIGRGTYDKTKKDYIPKVQDESGNWVEAKKDESGKWVPKVKPAPAPSST